MYKAIVIVKRRPSILDPQGKAVEEGAKLLGLDNISGTRIGKYVEFSIDSESYEAAEKEAREYAEKLLSNPIMEDFEFHLEEAK